jgi:hypothetical protein
VAFDAGRILVAACRFRGITGHPPLKQRTAPARMTPERTFEAEPPTRECGHDSQSAG